MGIFVYTSVWGSILQRGAAIILLIATVQAVSLAHAQQCPAKFGIENIDAGNNVLGLYRSKSLLEAGERCASDLFERLDLNSTPLTGKVIRFLDNVANLQRSLAEKKTKEANLKDGAIPPNAKQVYGREKVTHERAARWLRLRLRDPANRQVPDSQDSLARHISYWTSATALIGEYRSMTEFLPSFEAIYIDEQAAKTWLRAVYSCDQWNGSYGNVCASKDRSTCSASASQFLVAAASMPLTNFSGQQQHVEKLKRLSQRNGCLAIGDER